MHQFGPLLNSLFHELREMDDEYPHNGDLGTKKNRDRVLRRAALRATMEQLAKEQKTSANVDATNLQIEELQSMCNEFNRRVLDAANQQISDRQLPNDGPEADDESSLDLSGIDLGVDFPEHLLTYARKYITYLLIIRIGT
ncbi:hypothetical protein ACHAPU_003668 [Fusarium lateritium]